MDQQFDVFLRALAGVSGALAARIAEWNDRAPTPDASALAQEAQRHARALAALRGEPAPRETQPTLAFLDEPFLSWAMVVTANALVGNALVVVLEAARASTYAPLRTGAAEILADAEHARDAQFKQLAEDAATRFEIAAIVDEFLPQVLRWFRSTDADLLARAGILDADAEMLRARYLNRVGPLLSQSAAAHLFAIERGKWNYRR